LQQRLAKTGGRLVKHARYYWLLLAESHLTRRLFGTMLRHIWALPVATGLGAASATKQRGEERAQRLVSEKCPELKFQSIASQCESR
jgi:hypothetical protein